MQPVTKIQQPAADPQPADWKHKAAWLALGAALTVMFAFIVRKMWYGWFPAWDRMDLSLYHRFIDGDSYYTHGPLVLLVSAGLFWFLVRRARIVFKPSVLWGTVAIIASLLLYLAGCAIGTTLVRGAAWIVLLGAIVLRFWGRPALGKLYFPILFLLFMLPMPTWLISDINLALKMAVTQWGITLANLMGIMADHNGTQILVWPNKPLVVGDVCSGLRTIISLLAFGAAYTFVCRLPELSGLNRRNVRTRLSPLVITALLLSLLLAVIVAVVPVDLKYRLLALAPLIMLVAGICCGQGAWRIVLFGLTVPVALAANCLRVTSLIVVTDIWDEKIATGAYHDTSGLVVFVLAFLMMFGLEKLILAAHRWVKRPIKVQPLFGDLVPRSEAGRQGLFRQASSPALLVLSVLGILMGVAAWRLDRPPNAIYVQNNAAKALPADLSVQDNKLSCTEMTLDENTLTLLNTRDYLYRRYSGLDKPVDICIIFSKDNPTSSHPPELCLTAGGGDVLVSNDVVLDRVPEMLPVDCRELVVQQRQGGLLTYYVYTFKYGKSYTKRFAWQQVWLFFKSRLFGGDASGALIRVSTPIANNDSRSIDEARRRAQEFMRASLPYLDRGLD